MAAARFRQTQDGRDVAEVMLRGADALTAKPTPQIKLSDAQVNGLHDRFDRYVHTAFAGNGAAYAMAFEAVKAVYAGLSLDSGNLGRQDIDGEIYARAADAYFGKGSIINWGSDRMGDATWVIAPYGMDEADFRDSVRASIEGAAHNAGFDEVRAKTLGARAVPRNHGDGTYRVMFDGEYVADPRSGRDLIVRVGR